MEQQPEQVKEKSWGLVEEKFEKWKNKRQMHNT
jgi:hypothetical protein